MSSSLRRNYSEYFVLGTEDDYSRNIAVEWLTRSGRLCVTYCLLLGVTYGGLRGFLLSTMASTVTNLLNIVITFLGLHWAKGSPDPAVQGE